MKKIAMSSALILSCVVAGNVMAANCPDASSFRNMQMYGAAPSDGHKIWVKAEAATIKVVSTKKNKSYQDAMKSATAQRLYCDGVPASATVCVYTGPRLKKALDCNFLMSNAEIYDMPAGTAFAVIDPDMVTSAVVK